MATKRQKQPSIREIAKRFGYSDFRPGQEEAISEVLAGHDVLAVMPTGSGKSAIYQIAAVILRGPTVVVSPLIALQRDQAESIEDQPSGAAAIVNSARRASEIREAFQDLAEGELEFLFLAPEQLHKEDVMERLQASRPSLFVVDEAHCISEWGHDFRPDYLKLGGVIEGLGHPRVLALTATAAPMVREEIVERLRMRDSRVIVRGFNRPNIRLGVQQFPTREAKREALLDRVEEAEKPGIVYVATRKHAEEIADALEDRGVKVVYYHGGMRPKDRDSIQEEFMSGRADVIVATNAFGMGVDKPDVRFVYHYDISDSVDAYYQEVGRAGRDGQPAKALLFYRPQDLNLHKFFAGGGRLKTDEVEEVAELIQAAGAPIEPEEIGEKTDLSRTKVARALSRLEEAGVVEELPGGAVAPAGESSAMEEPELREAAETAVREEERLREYNRFRLERMRGYAEVRDCRRRYLLNYFGEEIQPCGYCDNCEAGLPAKKPAARSASQPFPLKTRVVHKAWGKGLVESYDGDRITVLFDEAGKKTLAVKFVRERGILREDR